MTTLILVEGFSGSGKSTTAQWLAIQWSRQGRACRWIYEHQASHPVCGPSGVEYRTWNEFFEERLARWVSFTAAVQASGTLTILESAFLQHLIMVMLRREVDADMIVAFIRRIGEVIRPLDPRLVYFLEPHPDMAYREICGRRGPAWTETVLGYFERSAFSERRGLRGFDGLMAYWREHNTVADRAVAELDLDTLVVDPRLRDWTWRRSEIARFLELPPPPDSPRAEPELARYVGRYRVAWNSEIRECSVTLEDGSLVLHDLLWPANRLIWKEANVFYAESWPVELIFEQDAHGTIRSLTTRV